MKRTGTVLDDIVAAKRQRLSQTKDRAPLKQLKTQLATQPEFKARGFFETLKARQPNVKIIAEVKRASPSAGTLRDPFEVASISQIYQAADNVVAISIVTERDYFEGSDDILSFFAVHNDNQKPLLRKDFIFDPYQIVESKFLGAQAYLLIASLFDASELDDLVRCGLELGIEPLVEVHNPDELAMALHTKARCIGVNSRDLRDFTVDTGTHRLLGAVPKSYARIAESGIGSPEHLQAVSGLADAALIGSQLMRSADMAAEIRHLVGDSS